MVSHCSTAEQCRSPATATRRSGTEATKATPVTAVDACLPRPTNASTWAAGPSCSGSSKPVTRGVRSALSDMRRKSCARSTTSTTPTSPAPSSSGSPLISNTRTVHVVHELPDPVAPLRRPSQLEPPRLDHSPLKPEAPPKRQTPPTWSRRCLDSSYGRARSLERSWLLLPCGRGQRRTRRLGLRPATCSHRR